MITSLDLTSHEILPTHAAQHTFVVFVDYNSRPALLFRNEVTQYPYAHFLKIKKIKNMRTMHNEGHMFVLLSINTVTSPM